MSRLSRTAALLEEIFGVTPEDGSMDQAEYLLSIHDMEDVAEWLTDALDLPEDDVRVPQFVDQLSQIKSDADTKTPIPKQTVRPVSRTTVAPAATQIPTPIPAAPVVKAPRVRKPIPKARTANREQCSCVAKVDLGGHPLIGNCLECGRVICAVEDYGSCLFCAASAESVHWLDAGGSGGRDGESDEAVAQKDRLIQYDREGARRTKIYDDSTDWFAEGADVWKGKEEREEALRMAHEFEAQKVIARQEMRVQIDFATGAITVKDKQEAIRKVEMERDRRLDEFIDSSNAAKADSGVVQVDVNRQDGNVLDDASQALLETIRAKLGKPRQRNSAAAPLSIFSFLDEDANVALDSL